MSVSPCEARGFHIADFRTDHYEWSSGDFVGKGASGRVTRWNKITWDGVLEDEVCVKEFDYDPRLDRPNAEEGLNKEAWIHSQVNRFDCNSIVKLRGSVHRAKLQERNTDVSHQVQA